MAPGTPGEASGVSVNNSEGDNPDRNDPGRSSNGDEPRVFVLLGDPVGHSVSPDLHNAAFKAAGINCRYVSLQTPPSRLAAVVERLRALEYAGANVTVPLKEVVLPHLDHLSEEARLTGAVNVIETADRGLVGHNTDLGGFLASLKEERGFHPSGKRAVILGAGGAARAVCTALLATGAARVTVANRSPERALRMKASLEGAMPGAADRLGVLSLEELQIRFPGLGDVDLIVNATSVGMLPDKDSSPLDPFPRLGSGVLAMDLVFNPPRTRFLSLAQRAGCRILGGLGMLVYQADLAWRIWFGRPAPLEIMFAAAKKALAPAEGRYN